MGPERYKKETNMIDDEDDFDLTEEDWGLIKSIVRPKKMNLEKALRSSDPLGNINNNLTGNTKAQKTFQLLYAAILEVNSACVPILFDRFTQREIEIIYKNYSKLNARSFCNAIDTLKKVINKYLGSKPLKKEISKLLDSTTISEVKTICKDNEFIVAEMERVLLAYASVSIADLED